MYPRGITMRAPWAKVGMAYKLGIEVVISFKQELRTKKHGKAAKNEAPKKNKNDWIDYDCFQLKKKDIPLPIPLVGLCKPFCSYKVMVHS